MRIHKQRVIITITALLLIVFSLGCIPKSDNPGFDMEPVSYHGEDMDLYTVAAYNVLGAGNPGTTIRRIETDQFGRTLFEVSFLSEYGDWLYFQKQGETRLYSYLVCQKTEQDNVCFYEDECWTVFEKPEDFTAAENAKLKEKNDWDKPIDEKRLSSRKVLGAQTEKGTAEKSVNTEVFSTMTQNVIIAEDKYRDYYFYHDLLCTDAEGNAVYIFIIGGGKDKKTTAESGDSFFVLINTDGTRHNMVRIEDPLHYGAQLKALKETWPNYLPCPVPVF